MFGLPDYVIRVAVADQAAYEAFYMNQLAELPGPRPGELAVHDEDGQARRRRPDLTAAGPGLLRARY